MAKLPIKEGKLGRWDLLNFDSSKVSETTHVFFSQVFRGFKIDGSEHSC